MSHGAAERSGHRYGWRTGVLDPIYERDHNISELHLTKAMRKVNMSKEGEGRDRRRLLIGKLTR